MVIVSFTVTVTEIISLSKRESVATTTNEIEGGAIVEVTEIRPVAESIETPDSGVANE